MSITGAVEAVIGGTHDPAENAIPVHVIRQDTAEQIASSQHAAWFTFVLQGTEAPFQLLPQDNKRHRAMIWASGPGVAGNSARIGRQKGASNASSTNNVGAVLAIGGPTITYEGSSEVWCTPTGQIITISVLDERYE